MTDLKFSPPTEGYAYQCETCGVVKHVHSWGAGGPRQTTSWKCCKWETRGGRTAVPHKLIGPMAR